MALKVFLLRVIFLTLFGIPSIKAEPVRELQIAVAANFRSAAEVLGQEFTRRSGVQVQNSYASTGKFTAQILYGAPYDIFLAADTKSVEFLISRGKIKQGSQFVYAQGALVLVCPEKLTCNSMGLQNSSGSLAIANPTHAPYGKAARSYLESQNLWESRQQNIVTGENIGQTFQFFISGNSDFALVAYSQVIDWHLQNKRLVFMTVPQKSYPAILQSAGLIHDKPAAREYLAFLRSKSAKEIIHSFGYTTEN
ncbi:MAG: molybdate ABC transporter substrate-binding protein [Leptospiraceae bacterium]|nr:molybdate ABC transporter substrate-binding protein [Leptospiraceae bacterium]